MSQELRSALERAVGQDPQVDLTETAWARGRVVRRRRQAAQVAGGTVAAAALAGAFLLGGGLLEPQAEVGPATPTTGETAQATVPPVVPTTEETAQATVAPAVPTTGETADPTTPTTEPTTPAPDAEAFALTETSIDGVPLTGPTSDLVAAVTAELGEPFAVQVDAVGGCGEDGVFSLYNWEGFLLFVEGQDGPDAHRSWETSSEEVDLPRGVRLGMTVEEIRALDSVTEIPSVASPRYQLGSGIVVSTDAEGRVDNARSERGTVC